MDNLTRIRELVDILNKAGENYYSKGVEVMSNFEYDRLYDELKSLEEASGIVLANSPTVNVGYETLSELPKEAHESPMLSLDKTKDEEALAEWLGNHKGVLSWKLDGLTIVLTYEGGELIKAVTRGNGEIGEIITNNARTFKNIPLRIPYTGKLVVRGEAIITYSEFERINRELPETDAKYKNPRNLCSGSVRQLNSQVTADRNVSFYCFNLVSADGVDFNNSVSCQFEWLRDMGFCVVEAKLVDKDNIHSTLDWFRNAVADNDFPSDGLVITYEDIAYGLSLGRTAKFPRNSFAFKWRDEVAETVLRDIEWSASRTGLINPVAVFDTVMLEGTNVSRASLHNISILEGLKLGIGDTITVFKANMIIPQLADNLTCSGNAPIPDRCPVCGEATRIADVNGVRSLYCTNDNCQAKHIKRFSHFVSRDALNIDGLSEATLEKFVDMGIITDYVSLYHMDRHKDRIILTEGFGEKSYQKLIAAVDNSRRTNMARVIYSLGIPGVGLSTAKLIVKTIGESAEAVTGVTEEELMSIHGVGEVIARDYVKYFADKDNYDNFISLISELEIQSEIYDNIDLSLKDKVFVITGSVNHFANRNELKAYIEQRGGKVTGSVTGNTDYLINNDSKSASTKNKTAAKLGVSVITEEEFLSMAGE